MVVILRRVARSFSSLCVARSANPVRTLSPGSAFLAASPSRPSLQLFSRRFLSTNETTSENLTETASKSSSASRSPILKRLVMYADLSKARLSSLVVFTTGAGYLSFNPSNFALEHAPEIAQSVATTVSTIGTTDVGHMLAACVGTALCAASAGTFNQIFERHRDAKMKRTFNRPLPSGAISVPSATAFGLGMGGLGTALLGSFGGGPLVAALGAFNIFLYAGPYTYLKTVSEVNTWVGAIVGAIPPIMGYAAAATAYLNTNPAAMASVAASATGSGAAIDVFSSEVLSAILLAPEPLLLSAILFLWQFPHFMALSWMHRIDYARGGFQMTAVNDFYSSAATATASATAASATPLTAASSGLRTSKYITQYSVLLSAVPLIASSLEVTSWMYSVEATFINAYLLYLASKFKSDRSNSNARKIFMCSLWYLPLLLCAFVFHSKKWNSHRDSSNSVLTDDVLGESSWLREDLTKWKNKLKGVCLHEIIAYEKDEKDEEKAAEQSQEKLPQNSHLCIKLKADQAVEETVEDLATMTQITTTAVTNSSANTIDK